MRSVLAAVMLLALLPGAAPAAPDRTHTVTIDDYFTIDVANGCVLSADGARAVVPVMRWVEDEDKRNTDLWVVETATKELHRVTFDLAADTAPAWSPDGAWVYFLSGRKRGDDEKPPYDGKTQVWRVSAQGREEAAVTTSKEDVDAFALSGDGRTLFYTVSEEHFEEDDFQSLRKEFKKLQYGRGKNDTSQLWKFDLVTWRSEKLVDEKRHINEFAPAPDGRRIALITRPDPSLITNEGWSRVDLVDVATGDLTTLPEALWRDNVPSPYGWLENLAWSSDGKVLAFKVDFDGWPSEVITAHIDGPEPALRRLVRPREITVSGGLRWAPGSHDLCFLAEDRARIRVWRIPNVTPSGQGTGYELTPGDVAAEAFSFGRSAADLVVLMPGMDHPPDLFQVRSPGAKATYDRLTRLNPQVDTWKVPQLSLFTWTSPDGTPVEGILELPPGYRRGDGPLPLLVTIHGGPTASSSYAFRYWIYGRTYYAANGWAVLDPNYRGSTGYGDDFLTDLVGHENDVDVADILSGVDALIEAGIADSARMAVQGWSNGGYLTNCIISKDRRFKAASSGAGVFDLVMQWSIEDTPGHVINFAEGLPWAEASEEMHRASPLYDAENIATPTLIHVGENDARVPAGHARSLFRALHHYLDVPSELVVYPGEGHGLTKYSHRKAKMTWDQRWFEHYALQGRKDALPGS